MITEEKTSGRSLRTKCRHTRWRRRSVSGGGVADITEVSILSWESLTPVYVGQDPGGGGGGGGSGRRAQSREAFRMFDARLMLVAVTVQ